MGCATRWPPRGDWYASTRPSSARGWSAGWSSGRGSWGCGSGRGAGGRAAEGAGVVSEAVPGSTWAFLDAVALRRAGEASRLAERLLAEGSVLQVLVSQLHRRLRELVVVRDHLAAGTRPAELVRVLKLQPFRAEKLVEQAGAWAAAELDAALEGLLELDLASKGIALDGETRAYSDERAALALQAWMAGSVVRER